MDYAPGTVVKSLAGHDAGSFYVVMKTAPDACFIADGRLRRLEAPKRKNIRHLAATSTKVDLQWADTNRRLKEALRPFNSPEPKGR